MTVPSLPAISFNTLPIDWIILAAIALVIGIECFRSGPARSTALALALPLALVLREALSHAAFIGTLVTSLTMPLAQAAILIALIVGCYVVVSRMTDTFGGAGGILQALLMGIAVSAMVAVIWIDTSALQSVWHFGPSIQMIFGEAYRFWWLLIALLAIGFARS